jgi:restriction system protein
MASPTYRAEVFHPELKLHRVITGKDQLVVYSKAHEQKRRWDDQWKKIQEIERKNCERNQKLAHEDQMLEKARAIADEAASKREVIRRILQHTLSVNDQIDWKSLYDYSEFTAPRQIDPHYLEFEAPPNEAAYTPVIGMIDFLIPPLRKRKIEFAKREYQAAMDRWKAAVAEVEEKNKRKQNALQDVLTKINSEREAFYRDRDARNKAIEKQAVLYFDKDPEAVLEYCDLVLSKSEYPSDFVKEWELSYVQETSILIVDYELPPPTVIPRTKDAKFAKSRGEISTTELPESKINEIYDDLLYQICLRTIHELFEADLIGAIAMVVFNGYVSSISGSTGNLVRTCVMSAQASKEEFIQINLANVIPKECFKGLKGVGSSKLHGMAPVPPILRIDKSDSRIVEAYSVIESVDDSINLASMDWEDFEHLIREVFAAEFSSYGGEVHVTRASRDGGVDAIAFDPDPIRGGKIVIQAKRYTGSVDVGAVRDLYGTIQHEGATKGILVTTSNYGPDAYKFAKDKPIALLNGANLLHLLEKHGRRARIDLKEAKQQMAQQ